MSTIDTIGLRLGLIEHYPVFAKEIPLSDMTILYASWRLLLFAIAYQLLRYFWLTRWLVHLLERLFEHLWQLVLLMVARILEGCFELIKRILEELLRYRIAKIALIVGGIYTAFRGYLHFFT